MDGTNRSNIKIGGEVDIVLKTDQPTGKLTHGRVKDILTSSGQHHRGIKVGWKMGKLAGYRLFIRLFRKLTDKSIRKA